MRKRGQRINEHEVLARVVREGCTCLLSRGEAAALIAMRVQDNRDTARTARNRVAMQLDRAQAKGSDVLRGGLKVLPGGRYEADEIVIFAGCRYGWDRFRDLPHKNRGSLLMQLPSLHMFATEASREEMIQLPATLEACHVRIRELESELTSANSQLAMLKADLDKERSRRFGSK